MTKKLRKRDLIGVWRARRLGNDALALALLAGLLAVIGIAGLALAFDQTAGVRTAAAAPLVLGAGVAAAARATRARADRLCAGTAGREDARDRRSARTFEQYGKAPT